MAAIDNAKLPFEEQIAFFRGKLGNLVPTKTWTDVFKAQHDRAFMVAGAAKADLLADLAAAVGTTISDGKSIQWFRDNFDEIVAKHGWHYKGERNWRTRVIYQTNLSTSYAAGRLAQLRDPELLALNPYWMYKHNDSVLHPRPLHVSWDGLTLPADHPWFKTHFPPNGWGCKCRIVAVSETEALRQGGRITDTPPDDGTDPKTGTPRGIDYGWDYMPGDTRTADIFDTVSAKLDGYAQPLAAQVVSDIADSDVLVHWLEKPNGDFPLAVLTATDAQRIGAESSTVRFSPATAAKQSSQHPELAAADYARAQSVVDNGRMVQDTTTTLIYVLEEPSGYVMVVKATRSGKAVYLSSYRRLSSDQVKRDAELRRLLGK